MCMGLELDEKANIVNSSNRGVENYKSNQNNSRYSSIYNKN